MPNTGLDVFDETLQKTNALLKDIETAYGWEGRRHQAYSALRVVLHTLRDRLTVDEAADFGAQLPLLVKGVYFDQWNPSSVPKKFDDQEFMAEIRRQLPFEVEGDIAELVAIVLKSISRYVSPGELEDVVSTMPKKLVARLREALQKVA